MGRNQADRTRDFPAAVALADELFQHGIQGDIRPLILVAAEAGTLDGNDLETHLRTHILAYGNDIVADDLRAVFKSTAIAQGANIVRTELGMEPTDVPAADPALQTDIVPRTPDR